MRSAGCCVNDVADRDFDRHVKRTAQRPVTSGAMPVREALVVGAVLALLAFGLVLTTNAATIAWSIAALVIALVYPFAKRYVSMVREALLTSVACSAPPVSCHISQLSMVPKASSPRSACARAPGTLSSSHLSLVPEK